MNNEFAISRRRLRKYEQISEFSLPITQGHGVYMTDDGLNFFIAQSGIATVRQYKMSIPFDVSTASLWSIKTGLGTSIGVRLSNDGTKIIIATNDNSIIKYATLGSPFDLATIGVVNSLGYSTWITGLLGIDFDNTGTIMFLAGTAGIAKFTLSTPFDVTTSTFIQTYTGSSYVSLDDLAFGDNGLRLYTCKRNISTYSCSLGVAYDLSTIISTDVLDGSRFYYGIDAINSENYVVGCVWDYVGVYKKKY